MQLIDTRWFFFPPHCTLRVSCSVSWPTTNTFASKKQKSHQVRWNTISVKTVLFSWFLDTFLSQIIIYQCLLLYSVLLLSKSSFKMERVAGGDGGHIFFLMLLKWCWSGWFCHKVLAHFEVNNRNVIHFCPNIDEERNNFISSPGFPLSGCELSVCRPTSLQFTDPHLRPNSCVHWHPLGHMWPDTRNGTLKITASLPISFLVVFLTGIQGYL